ncbi:flavocytochrome c [Diplodia corticola]|uniref:Fumarate reductase n=1 Tax=Diplodia corticola TaxID=236234 RepID=A0A1J9RBA5_9PEZI|nr:flavocytochrome c [Diplodia corticola]OJD38886.1 flavocytochrome c [Diplodia corticola]
MTTTTTAATTPHAIVIGSGLAGLSAASTLLHRHTRVTLLERLPKPGGNSIKASSGINGAPTRYQPSPTYDTTFHADTVRSAGAAFEDSSSPSIVTRAARERLIATLTQRSAGAVHWLADAHGVDLGVVAQLGGHTRARTHRGAGPVPPGAAIVSALLKDVNAHPGFELLTEATVTKVLVQERDGVTGVEFRDANGTTTKRLEGAVVFATGGFAGDSRGMLERYRPDLAGFPSTNEAWPGSAPLLTEVGAQLVDMEMVQVHPTGFVDPKEEGKPVKFLAAEVLRGEGGLMLRGGRRFVDELQTRQFVTDRIMEAEPEVVEGVKLWDVKVVLDEGAYQAAKSHVGFYLFKGLMQKMTVAELGGEQAVKAVQEFADAAAGKAEDPFGRKAFGHWELKDVTPESVVYVGRVTPVVHFTMGGVVINEKAEVLDKDGRPIKGVWAAGEVSGGIHGANRLGGSSLLECVVYGRIAGEQVAESLGKK